jgi:hypothetical protein
VAQLRPLVRLSRVHSDEAGETAVRDQLLGAVTNTPYKHMATAKEQTTGIVIAAPDIRAIRIPIIGESPLMINKFSAKAQAKMQADQEAGSTAKSKKNREAKDFEGLYNSARHISTDGWDGIHAAAFRNAAISACRTAGFTMTKAKLAIFVVPDGFDRDDKTPLVKLTQGEPEMDISPCRNATGVIDLRARPIYQPWSAIVTLRFDAGILTETDVINLMARVGMQVGIGEGRPDSKQSAGLGYGLFRIGTVEEATTGATQVAGTAEEVGH